MKIKILFLTTAMLMSIASFAQMDKSERKSPPAKEVQEVGDATITINYSQPSVRGRDIFGGLVPYNEVWRTGANEATTFETDKDIMVNGKKLPAGKYALFTIPNDDEWIIIFNKKHEQWGAYDYTSEDDVLRITAKPEKNKPTEKMKFVITPEGMIHLDWDETRVPFSVEA